jgi:hypothetical protein
MTKLWLWFNMGNSGGSWMEQVINSHPDCLAMEEPRRKLGLPNVGPDYTIETLQATLFENLREMEDSCWASFGYIKGFRDEILDYVLERGGSVAQQLRHPIRVLHGTRKRTIKAKRWWGREPADEVEAFQGHVRHMARRYQVFIDRSDRFPIIQLEDLMLSLCLSKKLFRETLETVTQVQWSDEDVERAAQVRPRHRQNAPPTQVWDPDYEENPKLPWEQRKDPPVNAIWEHWEDWQRQEFTEQFLDICRVLTYQVPEV